jgi:hypothetical protein
MKSPEHRAKSLQPWFNSVSTRTKSRPFDRHAGPTLVKAGPNRFAPETPKFQGCWTHPSRFDPRITAPRLDFTSREPSFTRATAEIHFCRAAIHFARSVIHFGRSVIHSETSPIHFADPDVISRDPTIQSERQGVG